MTRPTLEELYELAERSGWQTREQQRYSLLGLLHQIATTEQLEMIANVYKKQAEREDTKVPA